MGRFRFLVFYLLGGFAATALQTLVTFHWGQPGDSAVPNLGASGRDLGGARRVPRAAADGERPDDHLLLLHPRARATSSSGSGSCSSSGRAAPRLCTRSAGGGVAFFAHVGGFAFGVLTVHLFKIRDPLPPAERISVAPTDDPVRGSRAGGTRLAAARARPQARERRGRRRGGEPRGAGHLRPVRRAGRTCRRGSRSTAVRSSRTSAAIRRRSSRRSESPSCTSWPITSASTKPGWTSSAMGNDRARRRRNRGGGGRNRRDRDVFCRPSALRNTAINHDV